MTRKVSGGEVLQSEPDAEYRDVPYSWMIERPPLVRSGGMSTSKPGSRRIIIGGQDVTGEFRHSGAGSENIEQRIHEYIDRMLDGQ